MQNTHAIVTALLISSAMIGCNSNSPKNVVTPPAGGDQISPPPAAPQTWRLKLQSKCQEEVAADQCLAGYGFAVYGDGRFEVGPTEQGKSKTGNISPDELTALISALNPILSAPDLSAESHIAMAAEENPSEDTVTFSRGDGEGDAILHTTASDLSYRTQSGDQAKSLLSALKNLAVRYYTLPFPDSCGESVTALQALYASLQTCTADADCAYFDLEHNVLDPASGSFLATDDCSLVKPLTIGNAKLIETNATKLIENITQVNNSCGERLYRADCLATGLSGFQLTGAAAVCKQSVCQAPSSVSH